MRNDKVQCKLHHVAVRIFRERSCLRFGRTELERNAKFSQRLDVLVQRCWRLRRRHNLVVRFQ